LEVDSVSINVGLIEVVGEQNFAEGVMRVANMTTQFGATALVYLSLSHTLG
jgi:hypothetical protein